MKSESLVIADQHAAVNTFPGLVHTARHTTRVCNTRSRWGNRKEPAAEGGADDWGEVVTRYPYRKVRMDHLLSMEIWMHCLFHCSLSICGGIAQLGERLPCKQEVSGSIPLTSTNFYKKYIDKSLTVK